MKFNYNQKFNGTVYYSGPYFDEREINAAIETLQNGPWLSAGEKVREFERAFSKKFDVRYSQMVNSGSSANLVMIAALKKYYEWPDGAEIIVSPVGFPTTIAPIVQNNLKPVFADIEMNTLNFNLNEIEKLRINKNTVAIFVSPVLGNPPDMEQLRNLANKNYIHLIGDNCDSLGSKWDGEYITNYYTAWSSSFYPAHHITTGEGGMISTNTPELYKIIKSLVNWGRDCHCVGADNLLPNGSCKHRFDKWLRDYDGEIDHKYIFTNMGYNLKPLDLQGAIGLVQLEKFDEIAQKRRANWQKIRLLMPLKKPISEIKLELADPCWFGFSIKSIKKELLVAHFEKNGIQTRNYFAGNILLHPGFRHLGDYRDYPNANRVLDEVFFIGCSPQYTEEHFDHIKKVIESYE